MKKWAPALVAATRPLRRYFDAQRRFDRRFGVETTEPLETHELGLDDPNAACYEPTPPATFARMMRDLRPPVDGWHFVDLGCGKGAVLMYAMRHGFSRITGVELAPQLQRVAVDNVARFARRPGARPGEAARVRVIAGDATRYAFPEEPTLCFLGNPFKGPVLDAVVRNLGDSLARAPRDVLVVYYHPLSRHGAWDDAPFLVRVRREDCYTAYRSPDRGPARPDA